MPYRCANVMIQPDLPLTVSASTACRAAVLPPTQRVRHWQLVRLAADGNYTQVYQARPEGIDEHRPAAYAVKILRNEWEADRRAIDLIRKEALVGKSVSHPHLISVLASGVSDAPYFVVMPWLSGTTLAARLELPCMLPRVAFWTARQIAEALGALHAGGWIHGDVKPSNIFVSPEGHATLLDLGLARKADRAEPSGEARVAGTWNYIAPEVVTRRRIVDIRSDIYSLGVVLFEMLTGHLPFSGESAVELAREHREGRISGFVFAGPARSLRGVRGRTRDAGERAVAATTDSPRTCGSADKIRNSCLRGYGRRS